MEQTEEGREVLRLQPVMNEDSLNFTALATYPDNSLGKEYHSFMSKHGYSPNDRTPVRFEDDPSLAYVLQRYREVHDFWHVLLGLPPTVLGEVAQKWFELLQTGLPVCALSSLLGPLRLPARDVHLLLTEGVPWAVRCHGSVKVSLISLFYERRLDQDIGQLRSELGLLPPPESLYKISSADPTSQ